MSERVRKYILNLSESDREHLQGVVRSQKCKALIHKRARILLLADAAHPEGRRTDAQIADLVGLTEKQVKRIRVKAVKEGIETTLNRKRRSDAGTPKIMNGEVEAQLVTLACSTPPDGYQRWTLQLLVDEMCRLQIVSRVCPETVRTTLKKIA